MKGLARSCTFNLKLKRKTRAGVRNTLMNMEKIEWEPSLWINQYECPLALLGGRSQETLGYTDGEQLDGPMCVCVPVSCTICACVCICFERFRLLVILLLSVVVYKLTQRHQINICWLNEKVTIRLWWLRVSVHNLIRLWTVHRQLHRDICYSMVTVHKHLITRINVHLKTTENSPQRCGKKWYI